MPYHENKNELNVFNILGLAEPEFKPKEIGCKFRDALKFILGAFIFGAFVEDIEDIPYTIFRNNIRVS
jgi:hypothetical protein